MAKKNVPQKAKVPDVNVLLGFVRGLWWTLRLDWALVCDRRVMIRHKLMLLAIAVYVISPLDLIPDVALGLGQADDIVVFMLGSRFVWDLCPEDVVTEHRDRIFGVPPDPNEPQDQ